MDYNELDKEYEYTYTYIQNITVNREQQIM